MLKRNYVDSSTLSKSFQQRMQSSRRGLNRSRKKLVCSKRYVQVAQPRFRLIKQEVKLLEEAGEGGSADVKELREARSSIDANEQTIREVCLFTWIQIGRLTFSLIAKCPNSKALSSPRSTAKTNWNNEQSSSNANSIVYVLQTIRPSMGTVTVGIARSQRQGRTTMIDVNYVKVLIAWMPVLCSAGKSWMMFRRRRPARFVRTARYVTCHCEGYR